MKFVAEGRKRGMKVQKIFQNAHDEAKLAKFYEMHVLFVRKVLFMQRSWFKWNRGWERYLLVGLT